MAPRRLALAMRLAHTGRGLRSPANPPLAPPLHLNVRLLIFNGLAGAVLLTNLVLPSPLRAQDLIRSAAQPIAESTVQLVIDSRQPVGQTGSGTDAAVYRVSGWASDVRDLNGTGIAQILAYLDGPSSRGRLLGWARHGLARPDVAVALNNPAAARSGFELSWRVADMPPQVQPVHQYTLFLYVESSQGWVVAQVPVLLASWPHSGQPG
jgi:hypothetical protein